MYFYILESQSQFTLWGFTNQHMTPSLLRPSMSEFISGKHVLAVVTFQHLPRCPCGLWLPSAGLWLSDVILSQIMTIIHDYTTWGTPFSLTVYGHTFKQKLNDWPFGCPLFRRKWWLLWTRLGIQSTSSVPSADPFSDQRVQTAHKLITQHLSFFGKKSSVAFLLRKEAYRVHRCASLLPSRFPWEGWEGVLQKGLLWHVCPKMWWLCPRHPGELHLSSQLTLAPWVLRLQGESLASIRNEPQQFVDPSS